MPAFCDSKLISPQVTCANHRQEVYILCVICMCVCPAAVLICGEREASVCRCLVWAGPGQTVCRAHWCRGSISTTHGAAALQQWGNRYVTYHLTATVHITQYELFYAKVFRLMCGNTNCELMFHPYCKILKCIFPVCIPILYIIHAIEWPLSDVITPHRCEPVGACSTG